MANNKGMTISELEQLSGFNRSTIHYYVQIGLLDQPYKSGQTMAYYDKGHLRRLEEIQKIKIDYLKTAKITRVPLDLIKQRLKGKNGGQDIKRQQQGPPAKPRDRKKIRKKEDIIEAALRLYASRGFYRTNVRDIAREAQITAPTFYHYFNDKRELFVEAIEYVIRKFRRDLIPALKNEKDVTRRSVIRFRAFYDNYPRIGEILNQLRAGVAINDQWAKGKLKKVYGELTEGITEGIQSAIDLGYIRDMNPELLALFFITLDETAFNWASMHENESIESIMLFLADFLYHGFLTQKGKEAWWQPPSGG